MDKMYAVFNDENELHYFKDNFNEITTNFDVAVDLAKFSSKEGYGKMTVVELKPIVEVSYVKPVMPEGTHDICFLNETEVLAANVPAENLPENTAEYVASLEQVNIETTPCDSAPKFKPLYEAPYNTWHL